MKLKNIKSSLIQSLIVVLVICIIVYIITRAIFTAYAEYDLFEKTMAICLLLSEMYIMFHSFAYFMTVFRTSRAQTPEPDAEKLTQYPQVDIFIPVRHEPKEILESTVIACYNLSYPAKTIYILDDSSYQQYKDETAEIARQYGCELFRRDSRHGAKAGVINDCLKISNGKYIALFDVDQNPISSFLTNIVSIMESNSKLALVQTPQYYSNIHSNKIAMAANTQQAVFYENICESKSFNDAMMCCGSNVILRRAAIESVDGFDESTVTEDFTTSLQLHLKHWETLYYNHVSAFGQGPEDLTAYLAQQNRWSMGGIAVLKKVVINLLRSPSTLKFRQWWEYFVTSTYYLTSWAFIFLLACPIIYLFFGIPSFFMDPVIYSLAFMPYLILSTYLFISTMKLRRYHCRNLLKGQALFFISLPTYLTATFRGLLGIKKSFTITNKQGAHKVPYLRLWPQILVWLICLATITWGFNLFAYNRSIATLINTLWVAYYFIYSTTVFYFNEE